MKWFTLYIVIAVCSFCNISISQNLKTKNDTLFLSYKNEIICDSIFLDIKGDKQYRLNFNKNSWSAKIYIPNVDEAIFQYRINAYRQNNLIKTKSYQLWVGLNAPKLSPKISTLSGQLINKRIKSKFLNENRNITIYLPPKYSSKNKAYKVVYLADGKIVNEYAKYIEPLISNKKIEPIVLVGVHSNEETIKQFRTIAYLKGIAKYLPQADSTLYKKHLKFFCEEAIKYVEDNFNVSKKRKDRTIFGFSNGASFVTDASFNYPRLFKNVVVASFGWEPLLNEFPNKTCSSFFLTAGKLEKDYFRLTINLKELLHKNNINVIFKPYVAAHEEIMWREFFIETLSFLTNKK